MSSHPLRLFRPAVISGATIVAGIAGALGVACVLLFFVGVANEIVRLNVPFGQ